MHNVRPKQFEAQLRGLLDRGFQFWPLREVLRQRANHKTIPSKTIVVTFDDGYQSVYFNARPILNRLQIPATVFVSTAYLDTEVPFAFDEWGVTNCDKLPLSAYCALTMAQCLEMADDDLCDFGAHTHTHRDFRGKPDEFREDLQLSVDIVRKRFGIDDVPFAFPFGSPHKGFAGDDLVEAAKTTGVTCGLTTEAVVVDAAADPFRWGRFNAFGWDTGATLAAKLGGWYSSAPRLRLQMSEAIQRSGRRLRPVFNQYSTTCCSSTEESW